MRPILGASNIYSRRRHPSIPHLPEGGESRARLRICYEINRLLREILTGKWMCTVRIHDAKKRLSARHEKKRSISQLYDIVSNFHEGEKFDSEKTLVEKIVGKILYKDRYIIYT